MAWQMPKTDWASNPKSPMAVDFNRIEGNIEHLLAEIETKKGAIVAALNNVGINSTIEDSYIDLSNKINTAKKTGIVITPTTVDQVIPKGIFDIGGGKVVGDADLVSANIRRNKNIFGVEGQNTVLQTANGTGILEQISNTRAALTVTGLSFKPGKVFVRGSVRCKYRDNSAEGTTTPNSLIYDYGIIDGKLRPTSKSDIYATSSGGFAFVTLDTVKVTCTVTYQANGFVVELRQTEPSGYLNMDNYSTQYWFAQE